MAIDLGSIRTYELIIYGGIILLLAIIVWISIIGIAFLVFGFMFKFSLTKEIREIKKTKKKNDKWSLIQHRLMIIKNLPQAAVITDDVVENMVNSFFKNTVEKDNDTNSLIRFFNKEDMWQTVHLKNIYESFALDNVSYMLRMLSDGKELRRASQLNTFTSSMLTKEITKDLVNDSNSEEKKYLKQMFVFHLLTKKYLLIAEEVAGKDELFLRTLNEHRNAYYYLMCCCNDNYINILKRNMNESIRKYYFLENIVKAYRYEYRAFFDTADILHRSARFKSPKNGEKRSQEKFDDYNSIKTIINDLPERISKIRGDNDIYELNIEYGLLIDEIKNYSDLLDELINLNEELLS